MSYESLVVGRPARELETPALLVDLAALERNIARTASVLKEAGVAWRPHSKGHKTPAIAHLEIAAGAIGITCAKLSEAEAMVGAGIKSILIANEVVSPRKIVRLANLCRQAEVIVGVDSADNVGDLDAAGQQKGVRIPVVVEVDTGMHRCGVQPGEDAAALSQLVHRSSGLRYMGLMAWEGHARKLVDLQERQTACERAVGLLTSSAQLCRDRGLPVQVVSCGGTGTEEISSRQPGVTEIQAGNIVLHDQWYESLGVQREFALTVLSTIISRPTPTRLVTDAGRYAMSEEKLLPRPRGLTGVCSQRMFAEQSLLELEAPNADLKVGDTLEWIVGYGASTVVLHDEIYATRDGIVEAVWPIACRGRLQ